MGSPRCMVGSAHRRSSLVTRAPAGVGVSPFGLDSGPYRLTVKLMALLLPAVVVTVTLTVPYLAFVGTLHLICLALHKTYVVHVLLPNFTELVPCAAPKFLPLMVTRAPRLAEDGLSFAS